jgi:predicted nucleic acid-binding Zn ribbon protein
MEERCICCGEVIPKGRQVCLNCEEKWGVTQSNTKINSENSNKN